MFLSNCAVSGKKKTTFIKNKNFNNMNLKEEVRNKLKEETSR